MRSRRNRRPCCQNNISKATCNNTSTITIASSHTLQLRRKATQPHNIQQRNETPLPGKYRLHRIVRTIEAPGWWWPDGIDLWSQQLAHGVHPETYPMSAMREDDDPHSILIVDDRAAQTQATTSVHHRHDAAAQ